MGTTELRQLTDAQLHAFATDGVVKIPGALAPDVAAEVLAAVDARLAGGNDLGGMDRRMWATDPAFRRFAFDTDLAGYAAQAMASAAVRIYFDQIFVKPADTPEKYFHWHQDHPFWAVTGDQICSTWVALTSASVASSALEFVRGSHRSGITYRPYFSPNDTAESMNKVWPGFGDYVMSFPEQIVPFEDHPDRYEIIGFDVEPGDALLFDYRLVHRSRGNPSGHRRVAVSWRWLGDDSTWHPVPGADPIVNQDHTWLAPGQRIADDDVFPVVHRRRATTSPLGS